MNTPSNHSNTHHLLSSDRSGVIIVDIQDAFLKLFEEPDPWLNRIASFLQIPKKLEIPILITEQTPEKLSTTASKIRKAAPEATVLGKDDFNCFRDEAFQNWIEKQELDQLLLVGIMTNVCILQTTLEGLQQGCEIHVAADGTDAESPEDHFWALRRMERAGALITTLRTAAYEWLQSPSHDSFRDLLPVLKELGS